MAGLEQRRGCGAVAPSAGWRSAGLAGGSQQAVGPVPVAPGRGRHLITLNPEAGLVNFGAAHVPVSLYLINKSFHTDGEVGEVCHRASTPGMPVDPPKAAPVRILPCHGGLQRCRNPLGCYRNMIRALSTCGILPEGLKS